MCRQRGTVLALLLPVLLAQSCAASIKTESLRHCAPRVQLHPCEPCIQAGSRTGLRHLYGACSQKAISDASQLPPPRRVEKENLAAFIAKKREIFMVQMSLDIKQQERRRLAQHAAQVAPKTPILRNRIDTCSCQPAGMSMIGACMTPWPFTVGRCRGTTFRPSMA